VTAARKRVDALQALRAIAASIVMLFHITMSTPDFMGFTFANDWFRRAFAGVDIFFVLSGFIIYHSVKSKPGTTRWDFAVSRFTRLYPIYWIVLAALIAGEAFGFSAGHPERLEAPTIVRSLLLVPSPASHFPDGYVLDVAWTLVIEVGFYALFALTFFVSERLFLIAMLAWGAAAMVAARVIAPESDAYWLHHYWLSSRVAEFTYGVLIAYFGARGSLPFGWPAFVLGVVSFIASLANFGPIADTHPEIAYGVPSALLVYGAYSTQLRVPRWLVEIGDASYVLYLVHGALLSILFRVMRKLNAFDQIGEQAAAWLVALLAVAGSYGVHRVVERPLLAWLREKTKPRPLAAAEHSTGR
jgi:exopolysaccharide production protein ExoZ